MNSGTFRCLVCGAVAMTTGMLTGCRSDGSSGHDVSTRNQIQTERLQGTPDQMLEVLTAETSTPFDRLRASMDLSATEAGGEILAKLANHPNSEVRVAICGGLFPERSAVEQKAIEKLLRDSDATVVFSAIPKLVYRKPSQAVHQELLKLLTSSHPALRGQAALAIGCIGTSEDVGRLQALLRDRDNDVRIVAAWAVKATKFQKRESRASLLDSDCRSATSRLWVKLVKNQSRQGRQDAGDH